MIPAEAITEETAKALAAMAELVIPDACLPGVVANLKLIAEHSARLDAAAEEGA